MLSRTCIPARLWTITSRVRHDVDRAKAIDAIATFECVPGQLQLACEHRSTFCQVINWTSCRGSFGIEQFQ